MDCPHCSSDLTPYDFLLWRYVKDKVFDPPSPSNFLELRQRITAEESVDTDTLQRI